MKKIIIFFILFTIIVSIQAAADKWQKNLIFSDENKNYIGDDKRPTIITHLQEFMENDYISEDALKKLAFSSGYNMDQKNNDENQENLKK